MSEAKKVAAKSAKPSASAPLAQQAEWALGTQVLEFSEGAGSVAMDHLAAKEGNIQACVNLGMRYAAGRGVRRNDKRAAEYFRRAINLGGDLQAQYILGKWWYDSGQTLAKRRSGMKHLRSAAKQGYTPAQAFLDSPDCLGRPILPAPVKKAAKPKAQKSTHQAEWALGGLALEFAEGAEGLEMDRRAADKGIVQAYVSLGVRYATGEGVRRNDKWAVAWFRRAIKEGEDIPTKYILGRWWYENSESRQQRSRGMKHLRSAAKQGYAPAQTFLDAKFAKIRDAGRDNAPPPPPPLTQNPPVVVAAPPPPTEKLQEPDGEGARRIADAPTISANYTDDKQHLTALVAAERAKREGR